MEKELQNIKSQQHDKKHAELSPSDDSKIPELQGDDGKHRKTQPNSLLNAATGASTSATKEETKRYTVEILYDEIKPIIQVIKIGLTREMIIPEKIEKQDEIQKIEIPAFYARKRVIGLTTILNELATNYLNQNTIWSYYARNKQ
ncbi:hypothetical protein H5410_014974 [Solanum commersonii]|uniref:Uncharacterized protein n=1 Tax=Solanum commersonii TaxID=4109 RepID=A0A9J5ZSF2_SOLCO|nr:hypothetical protein H5410_014974 [Solanum commersonii]